MVQWLRCCAPHARGPGSVPGLDRELDPTRYNPDPAQPNKYLKYFKRQKKEKNGEESRGVRSHVARRQGGSLLLGTQHLSLVHSG